MLETVAVGTPVLTVREEALAEVGGEASLHVDPYGCAVGAGLHRLAADDAPCADSRAGGRREGWAQAERFSMEPYRQRGAALLRTVLQGPATGLRPA